MSLKDIKNIRNFSGEGFFELTGTDHYITLGSTEQIDVNHEVSREDVLVSESGVEVVGDTDVTSQKAGGSMVLRETAARNIAYALMAQRGELTQTAETGLTLSGAAVKGATYDLGRLDVSITSITDGTDPLVEGTDYELDAEAGILTFLAAQPTFDVVYECAAIASGDERSVMNAFSASEGVEGRLLVVQRQPRGETRFKYTAKIRIYPGGALSLHASGSTKATVPVEFDVVQDDTKPKGKRFGVLEEVKNG